MLPPIAAAQVLTLVALLLLGDRPRAIDARAPAERDPAERGLAGPG